jgi:N-hydroxyarylamine O-acetyltransferase
MQIELYLERINYPKAVQPDQTSLCELHKSHMLAVPFENLDIGQGCAIQLGEGALWDKIVVRKRGGFCYELNGLFASLLEQIGFDITYLSARVFDRDGKLGIDFDHLALLARIPNQSGTWLVDVGFGDSFTEPLNFEEPGEQVQGLRSYRLEKTKNGYISWQRNYDGTWERLYFFDLKPRQFPMDYEAACLYHQTSPASSFTRGSIISLANPEGRISLEDGWEILTRNGKREKRAISKEEYPVLLKKYYGVVLSKKASDEIQPF